MKGMDVTEVINILIKKEYLLLATGRRVFTDELEYTTVVANAIKRFQSDFAIEATGVVDAQTVMLLKIE
jgi:murein L,D-transpeptidase YcbB/YkuD